MHASQAISKSPYREQDEARIQSLCDRELRRPLNRIEVVAAGMGARRFYRLVFANGQPATLIARQEPGSDEPAPVNTAATSASPPRPSPLLGVPPAWLPEPPLEPLRTFLEESGLAVPRLYARDPENGLEILEDVGTRTLMDARDPHREHLYRQACDLVVSLQALDASPGEIPAFGRTYDRRLLESKFWKFLHWTIPGLLGREANPSELESFAEILEVLSEVFENAPRRLAHRDFKAENLHWLDADQPEGRLVMIDVQGAFMAPPEYDLVCLLYDLQVDLPQDLIESLLERARPRLLDRPDKATFARRFDLLAVARLCKDVSHVVEAGLVRGDFRRWSEIPRGLTLLSHAAGRQRHTFPCLRALTSVIPALTEAARSSDSGGGEAGPETDEGSKTRHGAA